MQIEAFTTERSSPDHALGDWLNALRRLFYHDLVNRPLGGGPFRASLRAYASPRHKFAAVSMSSHVTMSRPAASARAKPYLLGFSTEGSGVIMQDGREAAVGTGDIVLLDTSRPLTLETTGVQGVFFDVPAAQMRGVMPEVDGYTAMRICSRTSAGATLRMALNTLVELAPGADDETIDHLGDAIPHLVAAALKGLPCAEEMVPRGSDAYHLQRVRAFARARLRDRDLSPETVARAVHLSTRYVHQLFTGQPLTLMRWIWSERLERCRVELATASLKHRSIREIAQSWGFNDIAHFSRAFKRQFGRCPLDFREEVFRANTAREQ